LVNGAGATNVPQLLAGAFIDSQRAFAEGIHGAQFVIVEHARHYFMAEQPEEVVRLPETWISTRTRPETAPAYTTS
jgi:pimeloyl-ACP methyl ester carboxylesterase